VFIVETCATNSFSRKCHGIFSRWFSNVSVTSDLIRLFEKKNLTDSTSVDEVRTNTECFFKQADWVALIVMSVEIVLQQYGFVTGFVN
jgi:hypothetical protein